MSCFSFTANSDRFLRVRRRSVERRADIIVITIYARKELRLSFNSVLNVSITLFQVWTGNIGNPHFQTLPTVIMTC